MRKSKVGLGANRRIRRAYLKGRFVKSAYYRKKHYTRLNNWIRR